MKASDIRKLKMAIQRASYAKNAGTVEDRLDAIQDAVEAILTEWQSRTAEKENAEAAVKRDPDDFGFG